MSITRAFADPDLTPDNFSSFSKQVVSADAAAKALQQMEPIPPVRNTNPMDLSNIIGSVAAAKIQSAGQIVFHTVGDTGGIINPKFQFAVADAMAADTANGASFWFHLGDIVYYFGQDEYYFAQFYDPYRNYNAPIFAIPGNHDGVVYTGEAATSLAAYLANFCAATPGNGVDSQGASRTTMDQPGAYFTLNAPFVKIIGLYSNTGEGGTQGVISGGKVGSAQLDFLTAQLTAAKAERANGQARALILATHHPPFTGSPFHIPSPDMLAQIDQVCASVGIWPDMHLSGHSHLYERYTRTVNGKQIVYLVAGMGGFYNLAGLKPGKKPPPPTTPQSGADAAGNPLTMNVYNDTTFGFLRMTASARSIVGEFVSVNISTGKTGIADSFTLDLQAGMVTTGKSGKTGAAAKKAAKKAARAKKAAKNSKAGKSAMKSVKKKKK